MMFGVGGFLKVCGGDEGPSDLVWGVEGVWVPAETACGPWPISIDGWRFDDCTGSLVLSVKCSF